MKRFVSVAAMAGALAVASASFVLTTGAALPPTLAPTMLPATAPDAIVGSVTGPRGPEAGIWVIAETRDLPTRFIKIVVTDDQGRFVLPELPKARYRIWARGYGLVDTDREPASPGARVTLRARAAADPAEAAKAYPANYWYAMLKAPLAPAFGGEAGRRQSFIATAKFCLVCHQIGNEVMRDPADNSLEGWHQRIRQARDKGDPAMGDLAQGYANAMQVTMASLGPAGPRMYADWTARIGKGALPAEQPRRPSGIERNVVISIWDWGGPTFNHDLIATDPRHPDLNAGGPVFGVEPHVGRLTMVDPNTSEARLLDIPDGRRHPMLVTLDRRGRVWFPSYGPQFLKEHVADTPPPKAECAAEWVDPAGKNFIVAPRVEYLRMYDPARNRFTSVPMCLDRRAKAAPDTYKALFFTSDTVIAWIDPDQWDRTGDAARATGWCPVVLPTAGRRRRATDLDPGQWTLLGEPSDPKRDTRIAGHFVFRARPHPTDGSIWFTATRDFPGGIVRLVPGDRPPYSCRSEYYEPPRRPDGSYAGYSPMNVDFDSRGRVWVALISGGVAQFDRSKCRTRSGPGATGQQCPQAWSFRRLPGPRLAGSEETADFNYGLVVDHADVSGLGRDSVIVSGGNSDSLVALSRRSQAPIVMRVPYPRGFYAREISARRDRPGAGWKGGGLWASYNSITVWHGEDADSGNPGLVKFQIRPDPLAR
ncbi:carboxypeptidase-like regulatory domain-containing protein [Rhizorhabdus wittichii]|uniref:carboxypeptidase-like regulatory domain-containing protein n=1 Tax=Rhizorhabdus wittichii TaxID=160791 RepID=UPI0006822FF9|nr:carboxypeptidase-like regulatory domain-containing protein [Rhizorhabdus wittichii]